MLIGPAIFVIIWFLLIYFNGGAFKPFFTDFTPSVDEIKNGVETSTWVFFERFPYFVFILFSLAMAILCFVKRLSLIPVLV
jgi:hypothetical protein